MSGQPDEQLQHDQFRSLLQLFELVAKGKLNPRFRFPENLLNAHGSTGGKSWLDLYDLSFEQLSYKAFEGMLQVSGSSLEAMRRGERPKLQTILENIDSAVDEHTKREIVTEFAINRFVPLALSCRCLLIMAVSQLKFKKPMSMIIDNARSGEAGAIFDLVKLDHSFLSADFIQESILRAELARDDWFFEQLAKSLKPDPAFWSLKRKRRYFAMWLLHHVGGYAGKSDQEWADILAPLGFDKWDDPEVVRKAREYHGF